MRGTTKTAQAPHQKHYKAADLSEESQEHNDHDDGRNACHGLTRQEVCLVTGLFV
jgi:hypothetical protein